MIKKINNPVNNDRDDKMGWFTLTIIPLLFVIACADVDIKTGFKDPIVTLFLIVFSIFTLVPSICKVMLVGVE